MTEQQFNKANADGKVTEVPPTPPTPPQKPPSFDENEPLLSALRRPRQHLTSAPTFTPRNFAEQLQLVDDGSSKTLWAWINRVWTQIAGGGGGPKTATFVIGPASNSDSASYDYVTDGTDDDVQIQAAIDALPSIGGRIIFREGNYSPTNTINIDKDGVTLQGQGKGTVIKVAAASSILYLIKLGNYVASKTTVIRDIYFDGNKANVGDRSGIIYNVGNTNVEIKGCYFVDTLGNCIQNDIEMKVTGCNFINWKKFNSSDQWAIATNGDYDVITDCYFSTDDTTTKYVGDSGQPIFNNNFVLFPNGYNVNGAFDSLYLCNDNIFITGNNLGSGAVLITLANTVNGNYFNSDSTADPASIAIDVADNVCGNYFDPAPGIAIDADTRTVISGNTIFGTRGHAIYCAGNDVVITNNVIHRAGQEADNTYSGIFLNGATRNIVSGNRILGGSFSTKLKYGIREDAGTEDKNIITNNAVYGDINTPISIQGANTINANNITT